MTPMTMGVLGRKEQTFHGGLGAWISVGYSLFTAIRVNFLSLLLLCVLIYGHIDWG